MSNHSNNSLGAFHEYRMAQSVWKVGSPILLLVGTLGNILSILVLSRKRLRKITTMFYLAVLACADLAVLYTGLLRLWLDNVMGVYLRLQSDFVCKLHMFLVYFSLDFSVWVLVAVTADRCLLVSAPFTAKRWCTLKQARLVVGVIAAILFLINMHYFWTVSVIYHGSKSIAGDESYTCYTSEDPQKAFFVEKVWPWIDFCVVCFVPFIFMVICNLFIVRQLVVSARNLRTHADTKLETKSDVKGQPKKGRLSRNATDKQCENSEGLGNASGAVDKTAQCQVHRENDSVSRGSVREDDVVFQSPSHQVQENTHPVSHVILATSGEHYLMKGLNSQTNEVRGNKINTKSNQAVTSFAGEHLLQEYAQILPVVVEEQQDHNRSREVHGNDDMANGTVFHPTQQEDKISAPCDDRHISTEARTLLQKPHVETLVTATGNVEKSSVQEQQTQQHREDLHCRFDSPVQYSDTEHKESDSQQSHFHQQQNEQNAENQHNEISQSQPLEFQTQNCQDQLQSHPRLLPVRPNQRQIERHQESQQNDADEKRSKHQVKQGRSEHTSPPSRRRPPPSERQLSRRPRFTSESLSQYCGIPSVTLMLLTVNTLFWLLTAPIVVFVIGYAYWSDGASQEEEAKLSLGWALVNMLQYTNNAVHFFLYCLTGPKFRQELAAMCWSPKHRARVHNSS